MKTISIKKLVKNKNLNMNGQSLMKCGLAKKIYLATFHNINNSGKLIILNHYKYKHLKMNLKKSKLL